MPSLTAPSSPLDRHWRARLLDIQDLCFKAADVHELSLAVAQITAVLQDEWTQRDDAQARQLVREAYDLLTNPESRVDRRDWCRAAAPLVQG